MTKKFVRRGDASLHIEVILRHHFTNLTSIVLPPECHSTVSSSGGGSEEINPLTRGIGMIISKDLVFLMHINRLEVHIPLVLEPFRSLKNPPKENYKF